MNRAATPIRKIDRLRPKISTIGCSRAAPATASTLSSDIERSAMMICPAACANVLRGAWPATVPSALISSPVKASTASSSSSLAVARSSRHIFQHTQSNRTPPANRSPTSFRSCVVIPANITSKAVAPAIPNKIALVRCCSGNPAAAMPTTMALSPARARSIITTWKSAAMASGANKSIIASGDHRKIVEPVEQTLRIAHHPSDDPDECERVGEIPNRYALRVTARLCEKRIQGDTACNHDRQDAENGRHQRQGNQEEKQESRRCGDRDQAD